MRASRLVTITGVGGVGKTRLANPCRGNGREALPGTARGSASSRPRPTKSRCCRSSARARREPASVVDARGQHPRLAPPEAACCSCSTTASTSSTTRVGSPRASFPRCPGVRILATSREGLGVEGEQIVALRSLSVPERGDDVEAIAASDAVALFVERAPRGARRLRDRAGQRRRGRGDLPAPRRHPARDRARRGAGRRDDARRDREPARRTVPPADRRTAHRGRASPDPAPHGRLVVLVARRTRAHGVRPAERVRGNVRLRGGARPSRPATASRRGTSSTPSPGWWRSR